jgi:hypothetical protein
MSNESRPEPAPPGPSRRKPYRAPVLTEYGSISKLTRTGGATRFDIAGGMMRMK